MTQHKQDGFTLIELVVVIVILGILAAFAVPRFMGLETQARIASVIALEGTLRSAATMAHSVALASGNPATITVEGKTITMVRGYPNRATIADTLAEGTVGTAAGRFSYTANNGQFRLNGATTPANCRATYTQPAGANLPPTIAIITSDC
ncbi:MAG: type II secretion system protein [Steroidobacteraceae bacterium]